MDQSQSPSAILTALARLAIRLYQGISIAWPPRCRFYPTCSAYVDETLRVHGLAKGLVYGAARLLKCHPWHPGGYDPVRTASAPTSEARPRRAVGAGLAR
jgi:putative membrane protein insertion efficiency factor